ncbi:hypothetical protein [Pseudobacteriovorax antillogorgiicola]|uniref:Membrane bound FAD containing D-sorbitol dehydrogenase n=1 Tax=Pseudobacteriovorax antillogorgiicola TaxID=1513793 RepID=A0A1Y6CP47_9BACT|nr:hypothetical protein [Pseudobacteriovorax antillogorgiicola]TCS47035.1 D-sorbitol dehydrogenase-like protein [Pseudobacteriovorax antillogorgiicola]SMF65363.1 Membrane bound FAD containing D-sorbitol dehydrogenase [Pseudobacteriovorax antillogorgiicola]
MTSLDRRKLISLAAAAIGVTTLDQYWLDALLAEEQVAPPGFIKLSESLLEESHLDPVLALAYWRLLKQKFKLDENSFRGEGTKSKTHHPNWPEIEMAILKMWLCASNELPLALKAHGYVQALVWKLIGITPPSVPYGTRYDLPGSKS